MRFLVLAARTIDKIDVFYKNTTGNIFFDFSTIDEMSAAFDSSELSEEEKIIELPLCDMPSL